MVTSGLSEDVLQNHQLDAYVFGSLSVKTPHNLMHQNDDSQTPMGTDPLKTGTMKNAAKMHHSNFDMAQMAKQALKGGVD